MTLFARLTGRADGGTSQYVLSGFDTVANYDDRVAVWEPDEGFEDVASAESSAQAWVATQGPEAQVEIIRMERNEGTVVAVVTATGTEPIPS